MTSRLTKIPQRWSGGGDDPTIATIGGVTLVPCFGEKEVVEEAIVEQSTSHSLYGRSEALHVDIPDANAHLCPALGFDRPLNSFWKCVKTTGDCCLASSRMECRSFLVSTKWKREW